MPRKHNHFTQQLIQVIDEYPQCQLSQIYKSLKDKALKKQAYDTVYRLISSDLIVSEGGKFSLTEYGKQVAQTYKKETDGIWRIVIYDIPESQRKVRNILRQKLEQLGFKMWQNSIWVSPFVLASQVESELDSLAKSYFVRLIKTDQINYTKDLYKLFPNIDA